MRMPAPRKSSIVASVKTSSTRSRPAWHMSTRSANTPRKIATAMGLLEYATKLVSAPGKQDGLYWPTKEGEPPSPFGPLITRAAGEGYGLDVAGHAAGLSRLPLAHSHRARRLSRRVAHTITASGAK